MKLREAIERVDRSEKNKTWADIDSFRNEFGLETSYDGSTEFANRVSKYWLAPWLCTDQWVGMAVYYFDDKPIATSFQSDRKSDENIQFISEEIAAEIRNFILSLNQDTTERRVAIIGDLDKDIGETFGIDYATQLVDSEVFVDGRKARVVRIGRRSYPEDYITVDFIDDDTRRDVAMSDVEIPIRVNPKEG